MKQIDARANLVSIISKVVPVLEDYANTKTLAQYTRQLRQYARDYFTQKIGDDGFLDKMISAISEQVNRAWNEGMRANGLSPADKDEEMQDRIDGLIENEQNHITSLSDLINAQRAAGVTDMTAINARCDLWANRYTDVVNIAKLETAPGKWRYVWVYGDTEHCDTCTSLNGKILTADEWRDSGYHPQQPPNDMLDCGGWRCQCRLDRTRKRRTGL